MAIPFLVFGAGCESSSSNDPPPTGGSSLDAPAVHERDFAQNPSFRAPLGMSVVLDLESSTAASSPSDTGAAGVDVIPYTLASPETIRMCASDLGPTVADVLFTAGSDGRVVFHLTADDKCASADLEAGDYDATITRTPSADGKSVPVFVHESSLLTSAAQCGADTAPNDVLVGAADDGWGMYTAERAVVPGDRRVDTRPGSGFNLRESWSLTRTAIGPGDTGIAGRVDGMSVGPSVQSGGIGRGPPYGPYGWSFMPVADGAPWTFKIGWREYVRGNQVEYAWQEGPGSMLLTSTRSNPYAWTRVTLPIRYVPRGGLLRDLRRGEVALYENCDFTGQAFVINDSNRFPRPESINQWFQPKSIRVGCDTTLLAYTSDDPSARPVRIADTTDRAVTQCNPIGAAIKRMAVTHTRQITIESKTCTRCNLARVDLHGLDLAGLNITGGSLEGANFQGARLPHATFDSVSLKDASFSDANLVEATFRGAAAGSTEGSNASFERASLVSASISSYTFDSANLRGSNLDGSSLSNVSLGGATLDGANLTHVALSNVDFSRTNLLNTQLDAQPRFALPAGQTLVVNPCDGPRASGLGLTRFTGATVRFSQLPPETWRYLDLTNANLDSSDLTGSQRTLTGRTLCGLLLGGVDLTGFDLSNTHFDRSDLRGANLSNATATLATFNRTTLDGSTFDYADLTDAQFDGATADGASATANVSFAHALFRPATMNQARFPRVIMSDAIVKFPPNQHDGVVLDGGQFLRTDFTDDDLGGLSMTGGQFSEAIFVNAKLNGTKLGISSSFSKAIFCGTHVKGASFDQANLSNAFFPQVAGTTTKDTNNPNLQVPCDPIQLDGAASIEAAVTTRDARCPDGSSVGTAGCSGTNWVLTNPVPRDICSSTPASPTKSCYACTDNCQCRTKVCLGGFCACGAGSCNAAKVCK